MANNRGGRNKRKVPPKPNLKSQPSGSKNTRTTKRGLLKSAWCWLKFNRLTSYFRKRRARRRIELRNHPERDSSKHFATIVAVVAMIATTVTTIYVTKQQSETTRENSRIQAELFDQNQTRSFLRSQRQSAYAQFDATSRDMLLVSTTYLLQYPSLLSAGLVDPAPYEKVMKARFDFWGAAAEAKIIASDDMLAVVEDVTERYGIFINETERIMRAFKDNPDGPTIPQMIDELDRSGATVSTKYDGDDFAQIAREDLGNGGHN